MSDYEALTLQGVLQEICPVKKYDHVFENIIVDGKYIRMGIGAVWKAKNNIKVGNRVEVVYKEITDEEGNPVLVGISVKPLGNEQELVDADSLRPPKGFIRIKDFDRVLLVNVSQIRHIKENTRKGYCQIYFDSNYSCRAVEMPLSEIEELIRKAQA